MTGLFRIIVEFPEAVSVHPEMVDFGFRQGPSEFSTAGITRHFEDWKRAKTPQGPKDAVYGWTLVMYPGGRQPEKDGFSLQFPEVQCVLVFF
jgi:hypothetical protein